MRMGRSAGQREGCEYSWFLFRSRIRGEERVIVSCKVFLVVSLPFLSSFEKGLAVPILLSRNPFPCFVPPMFLGLFCFAKFVEASRVGSTYRPFPTSLLTLLPVLPFIPSHQHTTSSLCVSLSFAGLLGGFVSAAFRTFFNHKTAQLLAFPYLVGHSTAAAGKVNTRQRSAVSSKIRTYLINLTQW